MRTFQRDGSWDMYGGPVRLLATSRGAHVSDSSQFVTQWMQRCFPTGLGLLTFSVAGRSPTYAACLPKVK